MSVRELGFYPIFGILAGSYICKHRGLIYTYNYLIVYVILTLTFAFVFPDISYGPTNRLKSLWDREHEPGIIAALMIIFVIYNVTGVKKLIIILASVALILLSGSRSAIVAVLLTVMLLEIREFNFIKIIILILICYMSYVLFETLTVSGRSIDHNLIERILQYQLALDAVVDSNLLGIGPDKYGVLGDYVVEYCYNGSCTTTMDSSIIKYVVNYGVIFIILSIWLLYRTMIFSKRYRYYRKAKSIIGVFLASLIFGLLTGKLGAFPLNVIFYMTIGVILQLEQHKTQKMVKKDEDCLCSQLT